MKFLFTLQAQQSAYISLRKVLNCTQFSCIWVAFWSQILNTGFYSAPPYPPSVGASH